MWYWNFYFNLFYFLELVIEIPWSWGFLHTERITKKIVAIFFTSKLIITDLASYRFVPKLPYWWLNSGPFSPEVLRKTLLQPDKSSACVPNFRHYGILWNLFSSSNFLLLNQIWFILLKLSSYALGLQNRIAYFKTLIFSF